MAATLDRAARPSPFVGFRREHTPTTADVVLTIGAGHADGAPVRRKVEIVQIRVADIEAGDVVNRRGPEKGGWIEVERLETLPSGDYVVHDVEDRDSFTATGYDLVWLQIVTVLHENSHLPIPG